MQFTDAYNNLISISDDNMEASMYLRRKPNGLNYTMQELQDLLFAAGVKHGIKEDVLQDIIDNGIYDRMVTVAVGKPAVDGADGSFELLFRTKLPTMPKLLEDGSVDYLNIDLFERVMKDQLIAKYHKSTGGAMGYTVKGGIVMPKKGKEKPALRGKGFHISEDLTEYYADIDGKIDFYNGQIRISNLFTVSGDLDHKVGNIEFDGDVEVTGAVRSGMRIVSGGSVTIGGIVESASISAKGDVIIRGGVVGNSECTVETTGNFFAKFVENSNIHAEGTVSCNYLLNSNVVGLKGVELSGRLSVILGGTTESLSFVKASIIGNDSEVLTRIKVGIDDAHTRKLDMLKKDMARLNTEIDVFQKNLRIPGDNHDKIVTAMCMKVNERLSCSKQIEELEELLEQAQNAYVKVERDVYPRVSIRINSAKTLMTVKRSMVTFRRTENIIAIYQN